MTYKKKLNAKSNNIIRYLASPNLTVIGLILLVVLTVWGTLYQAEHGLYAATQKFFHSWFVFIFGIVPIPGTVLVMTVMFVNLVASLLFRIGFRWRNSGNILIHTGLLVLLVGGFITFQYSRESVLRFREGETARFTSSYHHWELAVWTRDNGQRRTFAVDTDGFGPGKTVNIIDLKLKLTIKAYHSNCDIFSDTDLVAAAPLNASGITRLVQRNLDSEPAANSPGVLFNASVGQVSSDIILYGNETVPTRLPAPAKNIYFILRKKRFQMPFNIKLIDFQAIFYPGSQIPKAYQSLVELDAAGQKREILISMNKPLRYGNYTLYQSSYSQERDGTEYSVLAVVQNSGRLLPYYSSGLIFFGLILHFIIMLFSRKKNNGTVNNAEDENVTAIKSRPVTTGSNAN